MKGSGVSSLGEMIDDPMVYGENEPSVSKEQLEAELADARLLHKLSIELIQEDGTAGLYKKIVEAAVAIMRSQFGTMQMLYPDGGRIGKLRLLACSGFTPEAENYWEWVYQHTGSSCGEVLRTRRRVIISDFRTCEFMRNEPTLPIFLDGGIYAAQSTPLYSRTGKLLGMISTHWKHPHNPPQRHLDLLDILARQAADLIERTQTAEKLKESEQRLRALATATNDVIYRMNADWTEMHQLDGRNFLVDSETTTDWLRQYIPPEDQEQMMTVIRDAIRTKTMFQLEHRVFKADGSTGWIFSRAIPIVGEKGNIVEWFGAASDITEKRSLLTELEEMVAKRTSELKRSNEDLQQFAHVASHDLKEPVRKIRTYGILLKNELCNAPDGKPGLFTDKILESARRMSTMIEGVLTYSSLNATEQKIELLNINDILSDILNDLEILIQQKNAVVEYGELPKIEGIQVLMYQLFYNLINNSLKFSKETERPMITIGSSTIVEGETSYAKIVVADNGIGFDPEHNETIFNTFARLHSKSKFDGTGLGLSLSRKIVERHGGTIIASGRKNEGATFTITLPLKRQIH
ncbi:MAG TPA: ATP-binding protein [Puia sp.]|jgi:signal transduction histidine kinase|nr:ATP-binding protein [Puia sp.]